MRRAERIVFALAAPGEDSSKAQAGIGGIVAAQQAALAARLVHDVALLSGHGGIQAYCLECPAGAAPAADRGQAGVLKALVELAGFGTRARP